MESNKIYSSKYIGMEPEAINPKYIELDSQMQMGYKYYFEENHTETIRIWIIVENLIMDAMQKELTNTFRQFDKIYNGNESVSNWLNDFDNCLGMVVSNKNATEVLEVYGKRRIQLNEQIQIFLEKHEEKNYY